MKITTFRAQFDTDSSGPGRKSITVTPSDDAGFTEDGEVAVARRLIVFGAGTVRIRGVDDAEGAGDTWTFTSAMTYPQEIPVAVRQVYFTGTSVTEDIKAIM